MLSAMFIHSVAADTPAFESGVPYSNPPVSSFTGTRGWAFKNNGVQPIRITAVGVFDDGNDGLANSHEVGVWTFGGALLNSATVPAGTQATLIDGYRYVSLNLIVIPGSSGGIIGAAFLAGDADDQIHPGLKAFTNPIYKDTGVVGRIGPGLGLPFPRFEASRPCEGCGSESWFEPNFKFEIIPEPHVSAFLGLGLVAWVLFRRKNGNRTGIIRVTKLDGASGNKALVSGVLFGG